MSDDAGALDALFRQAVAAMDAGDVAALERLLAAHPALACERLREPGAWLRDAVGGALDGFFREPYLLWFVAEDPVRNGSLPANAAQVAGAVVRAAAREGADTLREQLDYALRLVAWSGVAAGCGVQLPLLDVLVDAGASTEQAAENALVNGHFAAAEHLLERGARPTLAVALCLGRWSEVEPLARAADAEERQFAFVLAALNGRAEALARMIELDLGIGVDRPSRELHSHGTPLHHAVCSGSPEAVRVLVEAGAGLGIRDSAWGGTPLDWAEHYVAEAKGADPGKNYPQIAAYLREKAGARGA